MYSYRWAAVRKLETLSHYIRPLWDRLEINLVRSPWKQTGEITMTSDCWYNNYEITMRLPWCHIADIMGWDWHDIMLTSALCHIMTGKNQSRSPEEPKSVPRRTRVGPPKDLSRSPEGPKSVTPKDQSRSLEQPKSVPKPGPKPVPKPGPKSVPWRTELRTEVRPPTDPKNRSIHLVLPSTEQNSVFVTIWSTQKRCWEVPFLECIYS